MKNLVTLIAMLVLSGTIAFAEETVGEAKKENGVEPIVWYGMMPHPYITEVEEGASTVEKDFGVSIIYITHDLTTSYHLAKSIIVLYRGEVMEAGDVDMVIKNPKHPYTRLLIDSIPWPNIKRRWGNTEIKAKESELAEQNTGCKFASRCPFVFFPCIEPPPLFRLSEHQAASCYLFEENTRIDSEKLTELLPV